MVDENEFKEAIIELKFEEISDLVQSAIKDGSDPLEILNSLKQGLDVVGERYHNKEYFLSELFMAGETMSAAMEVLSPALTAARSGDQETEGTVVLGSIQGDVHDFGKNIAKIFLTASGFSVRDLGVDVPPTTFVDVAIDLNADVIGISAILSATQPVSRDVVNELQRRGLREQYKVILGGTGVTKRAIQEYGVDEAVNDATDGVNIIKQWLGGESS
jgi:5-methyltetrahydrofolate--homocysteine methyltransferase